MQEVEAGFVALLAIFFPKIKKIKLGQILKENSRSIN